MQRLVVGVILILAGIVGLGLYLQWFHVGSDNADGKSNVRLSVDTDKIQKDEKKAVAEVQDLGREIKGKVVAAKQTTSEGTLVSVSGDKLMMNNKEGTEQSHTLAADIRVTCDGKACKAADLKAGMRIRVTTEDAVPQAVTRIEAIDNNRGFDKAISEDSASK